MVPTWASDYTNLAKVSKLQARILEKLGAKTTTWILPQELTSMHSPRATTQMTTAVSQHGGGGSKLSSAQNDPSHICTCGSLQQCCSVRSLNEESQVSFLKLDELKK